MTSVTKAIMNACDREATITVTLREDGDLDIDIESDCDIVRGYAERLGGKISQMDVYSFQNSRINDDGIRGQLTATCLVPNAIYNAAFLELGMIAKSLAKKTKQNVILIDTEDLSDS